MCEQCEQQPLQQSSWTEHHASLTLVGEHPPGDTLLAAGRARQDHCLNQTRRVAYVKAVVKLPLALGDLLVGARRSCGRRCVRAMMHVAFSVSGLLVTMPWDLWTWRCMRVGPDVCLFFPSFVFGTYDLASQVRLRILVLLGLFYAESNRGFSWVLISSYRRLRTAASSSKR